MKLLQRSHFSNFPLKSYQKTNVLKEVEFLNFNVNTIKVKLLIFQDNRLIKKCM